MKKGLFGFLLAMWILILIGGGIVVLALGPISFSGYGEYDLLLSSGVKAVFAILLVIIWIFVLTKLKNWMFKKEIHS